VHLPLDLGVHYIGGVSLLSNTKSQRLFAGAVSLFLLACLAGCDSNEATAFPSGLEPLEENTAPPPDPANGELFPEDVRFTSGTNESYSWVHGRGFVHAPLAQTFAAMRNPDACVNRREVDEWTVEHDVETGYDFSYRIHNIVHDIITVEFDVTWRQGAVEGTVDEPTLVSARFQKTYGTTYIELMEGSIVARARDANTTEIELIEHLKATGKGTETPLATMRDYFNSVVALTNGEPLPTYP